MVERTEAAPVATYLNSNGRWYTVSLGPDEVRVSLDYNDKNTAQSSPGVLTRIRYQDITDVVSDPVEKSITIGTQTTRFVLPGWNTKRPPFLRFIRAAGNRPDGGERLLEEHQRQQPLTVVPERLARDAGLVRITGRAEEIQQFERPGKASAPSLSPTEPIPPVRSHWQMLRALVLVAFVAQTMRNSPDLGFQTQAAVVGAVLMVAIRMASTRVSFDDCSLLVRNVVWRRRIRVAEIEAVAVSRDSGFHLYPLQSRSLVVVRTKGGKSYKMQATFSLTAPEARQTSQMLGAFAHRHQIHCSVREDHPAPLLNRGGRAVVRAGTNHWRIGDPD